MSKAWYYEVMGTELGPIGSAELIEKAKRGQIQPDTRVRSGQDGKWQFAQRVKGLFPAPPEPAVTAKSEAAATPAQRPATIPLAGESVDSGNTDATYHFTGDSGQGHSAHAAEDESQEYEFFQFIGFSQAISPALHNVLLAYAKTHQLSLTQITRRALAEYLGRKELAEDSPLGTTSPADAPPSPPAV